MLTNLEATVIKEGESEQKVYEEFAEWCEDRAKGLGNEIKVGKSDISELQSTVDKMTADIEAYSTKIEDLGGDDSGAYEELSEATKMREKDAAVFAKTESDLQATTSMLQRAIVILEKDTAASASLVQIQSAEKLAQTLQTVLQASSLEESDADKLYSMIQNKAQVDDDSLDAEPGAPDAAVYTSNSGSIVSTLEDLLDKAQSQLDSARKDETQEQHNYELKKQSLQDSMSFSAKEMDDAKKALASCEETSATAGGDLVAASKDLASDKESLDGLHHDCMEKADEFESEVRSRSEELKALVEVKKTIQQSTGAASENSYSLLQESRTEADLVTKVLHVLQQEAQKRHSPSLAQFSTQVKSALRLAHHMHVDPFSKVRAMIADMLSKLEGEADEDADRKAFCDKELSQTLDKQEDKEANVEKTSTTIEQLESKSSKLQEEVSILENELGDLTRTQAEIDKLRREQKSLFETTQLELQDGIDGVKKALKILRDYYAKGDASHETSQGSASGIIGLLEIAESDFSKNLAQIGAGEEAAIREYKKESEQNNQDKTTKEQDVKYKSKEVASLKKKLAELQQDLAGSQQELDAVLQYLSGVKKQCTNKVVPYDVRKARREAEIGGLKNALSILEGETALLQRRTVKSHLRGTM